MDLVGGMQSEDAYGPEAHDGIIGAVGIPQNARVGTKTKEFSIRL